MYWKNSKVTVKPRNRVQADLPAVFKRAAVHISSCWNSSCDLSPHHFSLAPSFPKNSAPQGLPVSVVTGTLQCQNHSSGHASSCKLVISLQRGKSLVLILIPSHLEYIFTLFQCNAAAIPLSLSVLPQPYVPYPPLHVMANPSAKPMGLNCMELHSSLHDAAELVQEVQVA